MLKTVLKESLIVILLIIIILLILSIVFYSYIPKNKVAPKKIQAYELPQEVKQELEQTVNAQEENIIKTYYIDSTDLRTYESTKKYNKGKPNPFADYTTNTTTNSTSTNTTSSSTTSNKNENTTNAQQNETFLNYVGK